MCSFVPASHGNVDLRPAGYSSDRVDAMVWAFTDLLVTPMSNQVIFDLYRLPKREHHRVSGLRAALTVELVAPGSVMLRPAQAFGSVSALDA